MCAYGSQKRALELLELQLQAGSCEPYAMVARNHTRVLRRNSKPSYHGAISLVPTVQFKENINHRT